MLSQAWELILNCVSELEISFCKYTITLVTHSLVVIFSIYFPDILLWSSSFSVPQNTSTVERKDRGGKEQALGYGYDCSQTNNGAGNSRGMVLPIFVLIVLFHSVLCCCFDFCEGTVHFGLLLLVGFVM